MFKNIDQHLTGNKTIQTDPCAFILRQFDRSLYNDQRSCLNFSHLKACSDNTINSLCAKSDRLFLLIQRHNRRQNIFLSEFFKCPSKLWLKDNNCRHRQHIDCMARQEQNGIHLKNCSDKNECTKYKHSLQQHPCFCIFYPHHNLIDQYRNNDDLNNIDNFNLWYIPCGNIFFKKSLKLCPHLITSCTYF